MNISELVGPKYCGEAFENFQKAYSPIHGYVSIIVCLFGVIANLLNIIVLTRREMISPTNAILTGLAVADFIVLVEYIPYSWHYYLSNSNKSEKFTYGWALFVFAHSQITQVCHTISIWLTVALAIWRYIAVAQPQLNRQWCGMQNTIIAIAFGYIFCPLLNIPLYFGYDIQHKNVFLNDTHSNATLYYVNLSILATENNNFLEKLNFWIYSVIIKLTPCIALTALIGGLVCALLDAKKRRQALTSGSKKTSRNLDNERQTDRTTRMLIAILLLFLITELPQGILGLLSGILDRPFFVECYLKLGEVMDILALINSSINFLIYCIMSRQFRTTFVLMFMSKWIKSQQPGNGLNLNNTTTMVTQL